MDPERPVDTQDDDPYAHRKHRQSAWQTIPVGVKVSLGVCVVLIIISIATGKSIIEWSQSRLFGPNQPAQQPKGTHPNSGKAFDEVASQIKPFDLQLKGTDLNPKTRRIEGVVINNSDKTYVDVRIRFAIPSSDRAVQDFTTVTVAKLGPHAQSKFASDPLPPEAREWALINTTGTAR